MNIPSPPTEYLWAICIRWRNKKNASGIAYWNGVHRTRKEAIDSWMKRSDESWKESYQSGDRCIRVSVTPTTI